MLSYRCLQFLEKELKLSSSIGMNTHRVFLHDLLWDQDSIGFIDRIDQFLEISDKYALLREVSESIKPKLFI